MVDHPDTGERLEENECIEGLCRKFRINVIRDEINGAIEATCGLVAVGGTVYATSESELLGIAARGLTAFMLWKSNMSK